MRLEGSFKSISHIFSNNIYFSAYTGCEPLAQFCFCLLIAVFILMGNAVFINILQVLPYVFMILEQCIVTQTLDFGANIILSIPNDCLKPA